MKAFKTAFVAQLIAFLFIANVALAENVCHTQESIVETMSEAGAVYIELHEQPEGTFIFAVFPDATGALLHLSSGGYCNGVGLGPMESAMVASEAHESPRIETTILWDASKDAGDKI